VAPLRRYFSKRVPSAEVDDLVQEVFLRLQVHGLDDGIEHLDRYLFMVASNVLADTARRRRVRYADAHETLAESHAQTESLTPERIILDREALDEIVRAIGELPARTRDVFVLHRFEDMSCNLIAARLGISQRGVEKHMTAALRFLHAMPRSPPSSATVSQGPMGNLRSGSGESVAPRAGRVSFPAPAWRWSPPTASSTPSCSSGSQMRGPWSRR
jgi:RNA polymerase sigma-70 factor (ECF subfamily)